ncbi:hypothetical protein J2X55_002258 [Microbacterium sp. 1154]|uniref:hypothetical protein n=1 Tax=Microbacterium sp. 1154 TaxID=2817733 RepID=UPI0028601B7F|nr:hypothetical protein [Microbacterium sp. 1154]MDR6691346.1 hypothetical protein [Microbacterium sp. 1154]
MIGGIVARHRITVVRAPVTEDRRGQDVRNWDAATRTDLDGWAIDAGDTADLKDGRAGSSASWTIRGPLDADVRSADRIVVLGVECDIDGAILRQPGPSPLTSHTIIRLTRVEG